MIKKTENMGTTNPFPTEKTLVEPIDVVLACDENYITQLAVTVTSAVRSRPDDRPIRFHIICSNIRPCLRHRLEACVNRHGENVWIHWVNPPSSLQEIYDHAFAHEKTHLTAATIYRLAIDDVIKNAADTVIYLDVDTVVMTDLGPLLNTDLKECAIAGVCDLTYRTLGDRYQNPDERRMLEVSDHAGRINAGVMVIHRPAYRVSGFKSRAMDLLFQYPSLMKAKDEDALNAAMNGRFTPLDPRWNVQLGRVGRKDPEVSAMVRGITGGLDGEELIREAKILHYTGPKPWLRGGRSPGWGAWWAALRASGWFSEAGFRREQGRWVMRQVNRHVRARVGMRHP